MSMVQNESKLKKNLPVSWAGWTKGSPQRKRSNIICRDIRHPRILIFLLLWGASDGGVCYANTDWYLAYDELRIRVVKELLLPSNSLCEMLNGGGS